MTLRVCPTPRCPELIPPGGRCPQCAPAKDRARGTRQQRGYGTAHTKLRAQWAPKVATGTVTCWRCGKRIPPGSEWDLGHDDDDRTRYRGPEHLACNRSAAGKAAHR